MHVVILIWSNPVVVGHSIILQIAQQLLQRRVLLRQRVSRSRVVSTVRVGKEDNRVVFRSIVVLDAAIPVIGGVAAKGA